MPVPHNEMHRVEALYSYGILDTPAEQSYDQLSELAARICRTPVAYIKLVDEARAWFKSKVGLPPDLVEVPREITICAHTICQNDLVVIPDLVADERFRENPTVAGWPHLRFYCGMPLIDSEGYALGTMCVVDFEPREIGFEQQEAVRTLARQVVSLLELRRTAARLTQSLDELEQARCKADALLCDILPKAVAEELKLGGSVKARFHSLATILFGDFHGFSGLAASMEPARLVQTLDQYFGAFDAIVERRGLEKIKTIGDCYMLAGGVPDASSTQVVDTCLAALDMQCCVSRLNIERAKLRLAPWTMRIGIHAGPVMTGVVGRRKFTFDVWGDTVNVAQRMEAAGEPGRINVSEAVWHRVRHLFECEARGSVQVRARGNMPMYFLNRIKLDLAADPDGILPNDRFRTERQRMPVGA
ncbi:MAG TPA: adenylate/guanylate cyclase domain-containing protein [Alphaproteobacteria bacterium]|nr:adenylate/guanylate cyclase domain-containing protein [Alphaproteobacteria bacterium]